MIWNARRAAQNAVTSILKRTRTTKKRILNRSLQKMKLTMTERRMAFYAKLLDGDKLKLSETEAEEWRRDLPRAIEAQYFLIDKGCLPAPMTLENVRKLKTLHVSKD
jgi:hypothetical protein